MSLFGFGSSCDIEFELDRSGKRKQIELNEDGKKTKQYIYYDGEDVGGTVHIKLKKPGTKIEHQGIRLELIGQVELYYDRSNHHIFTTLSKFLCYPGEISENLSVDFNFAAVDKPHESYHGANVKLRYFLRLTIIKRFSNTTKEEEIYVHTLSAYPESNNSIKMEVGIEECLHIEFEYNKSKYHLKDAIIGKIYFLLVRIKVKYMELAIIKREIIGDNAQNETDTVVKYEIMDGAPVKGESIPIRLFLGAYDLTPSMRDVQKKFSVKYYLNLVLVDEEERRYFKQQEIVLWRKADKYKSKQERSDQMQVYESAQDQLRSKLENQHITDRKRDIKVRHDENGDLLNNSDETDNEADSDDNRNSRKNTRNDSD
ncbi:vacuolar sorting-associated 26B-like [Brachionus plicatilis]|uniref:Vacuolar sorting-associated 26B-like n=1 Tax=Brachionus plicatilis TaxID=10195 RepID=A0A3M7RKN4_BRAPC|nr:vacuolar sorting-associated 26B-like [Brachionus plicatilis]